MNPEEQRFYCNAAEELQEELRHPERVRVLEVKEVDDPELVERIAECKELLSLQLGYGTALGRLPERFGELQQLRYLRIHTGLKNFPQAVTRLETLIHLQVTHNQLEEMPPEIGQLKALSTLIVRSSGLRKLPEEIGQLSHLTKLDLTGNHLIDLPAGFAQLALLEELHLGGNKLETLPENFGKLPALGYLDLAGNQFTSLPASLLELRSLNRLDLRMNPFGSLPAELDAFSQGIEYFDIDWNHRSLYMDWSYKPPAMQPQKTLEEMALLVPDEDPRLQDMAARMEAHGVTRETACLRNAVSISRGEADDYSVVGCSRLGGFPDLEREADYPRTPDGKRWAFVAQINCAEAAEHNRFLPRAGLLVFFVKSTQDEEAKVLFYEGDLSRLQTIQFEETELYASDDMVWNPHRVRFAATVDMPYYSYWDDISKEADKLQETLQMELSARGHLINGFTYQHEPPVGKLGGRPEEWLELLSLGWDPKVGYCFGDAGELVFPIHQEDLRRHDFSRVTMNVHCG